MNKYKIAVLFMAAILAINVVACFDDPVEGAQETLDSAKATQSSACKACMSFGTPCSECTGVCNCEELQAESDTACGSAYGPSGGLEDEENLAECLAQSEAKFGTE